MTYTRVYVQPETFFMNEMPYSEVCMHMQVAGKRMVCKLVGEQMVQLHKLEDIESGRAIPPFSFPILRGEAGVFTDEQGLPYIVRDLGAS